MTHPESDMTGTAVKELGKFALKVIAVVAVVIAVVWGVLALLT